MKQQLNIRLSEPARRKLEALTQKYGSQTIVCEIAIDRLYQQEVTNMETIERIDIWLDDDGIIGKADSADLAAYDMPASISNLMDMVYKGVSAAYPDAEVHVHHVDSTARDIQINGWSGSQAFDDDIEAIRELIGTAFSGNWEVCRE